MGIGKLAFLLAVCVFAAAPPATADGSIAKKWANEAFAAVRSGGSGASTVHTGTPGAARTYALVTLAMYDAVNGIDRVSGNSTFAQWHVTSAGAPAAANQANAAAAAAHAVLVRLFPERASTLDVALGTNCSVPVAEGSEAGCRWGRDVGNAIYEHRAGDGSHVFPQPSMPPDPGLGKFPRRFSGYHFKDIAPFGVGESVQPYLSPGPPLSTAEYAESFNDVKELGSQLDTDVERGAIMRHWQAEGGTVRETGLWLKAALDVVDRQGTVQSLSDTTRLFALLSIAVIDSIITSWNDKFDYYYWRPGDAIRQAHLDGNDETVADPAWNPRISSAVCPPDAPLSACAAFGGTPEHTSGTSTFAGAASTVLAGFYCRDDVTFEFAREPAGATRRYTSFKEAAHEAGRSRIYGGIHFQFSIEKGYEAGKEVGKEILRRVLLPEGQTCRGNTCACLP